MVSRDRFPEKDKIFKNVMQIYYKELDRIRDRISQLVERAEIIKKGKFHDKNRKVQRTQSQSDC